MNLYTSIFNSGIFNTTPGTSEDAHRELGQIAWINPGPDTIYVRSLYIWAGVDLDGFVDLWSHFGDFSCYNRFGDAAWEVYSNAQHPGSQFRNFAPDEIAIEPGHDLTLAWGGANIKPEGKIVQAQIIYWVQWGSKK